MQSTSKIYQLGPNGLQELKPAPALEIGTKIIAVGYAGMIQNFAVYDNARHVVEIDTHEYLDAYFSPLNTLDEYTRPISEKFGIGFYYDLSAPKYTAEEIAAGLERAKRMEQAEQERKTQREEVTAICDEIIWSESADTYYTDSLIWNKCDYKEYLIHCALAILEYIDEVKECYKYIGETWPDGRRRATKVPISTEVKWAIRKDCRDYIANNTRFIEEDEEE